MAQSAHDSQALAALLAYYREAGVDWVLEDAPVDRFAAAQEATERAAAAETAMQAPPVEAPAQPVQAAAPPVPAPATRSAPAELGGSAHHGLAEAQALADAANSLDALRSALEGFDGCALKRTARQAVFADGNPDADLMLIGEAPGREEDARGLPFVGRSGQLLDRMLAAIGLDRSAVYIGNVIYWRPPGNRTPTPDERALCEPFIRRQIELAAPKVLMTLGGSALSSLFGIQGIMKTRGQQLTYTHGGLSIPTIPTLHPAALLRNPANKRLAWQDLLAFDALAKEKGAGRYGD